MSKTNPNKVAARNILTATFKSILEVVDACDLEDCIDYSRAKALENEFKKDVPTIFKK